MPVAVVNKRTHRPTASDVYIGRPSRWGNPFEIGRDGSREQVVALYRQHLYRLVASSKVTMAELRALDGKNLVCWCAPAPCHGHVLASAVQWACSHQPKKEIA